MATAEPFVPDRALYPFDSRWFQSSVGQVHYLDEGSGPPILFLHGNPTWSFLYRGIVIRLRKHFRCIAVDYPGFGLSVHPPTVAKAKIRQSLAGSDGRYWTRTSDPYDVSVVLYQLS